MKSEGDDVRAGSEWRRQDGAFLGIARARRAQCDKPVFRAPVVAALSSSVFRTMFHSNARQSGLKSAKLVQPSRLWPVQIPDEMHVTNLGV